MKKLFCLISTVFFLIFFSCGGISELEEPLYNEETDTNQGTKHGNFKILSLGDSYTIGQSVCEKCRFPEQLVDSLLKRTANKSTFPLKIIAQTGWTTSNLIKTPYLTALIKPITTRYIGVENKMSHNVCLLISKTGVRIELQDSAPITPVANGSLKNCVF
jgi:acyl-CoA thioesterase-1